MSNKIEDFKSGMRVKIGNSLQKSYDFFGFNEDMETMKGKIFEVKEIDTNLSMGSAVRIPNGRNGWPFAFHPDDLIILKSKRMKPQKQMFDPEKLMRDT